MLRMINDDGRRRIKVGASSILNSILKCDFLSASPTSSRGIMSPTGSGLAEPGFSAGSSGEGLELRSFLGEKKPMILLNNCGFDRLGIEV